MSGTDVVFPQIVVGIVHINNELIMTMSQYRLLIALQLHSSKTIHLKFSETKIMAEQIVKA